MRSAFFEYNVATSALFAARANLEVITHNVANAKTPGYSRQYAEQRATWPLTYYDGRGMVGTGVEVYGVGQMRNTYLDSKYWYEKSVLGEYQAKNVQMGLVQTVFNELSDTGNTSGFGLFFNSLKELETTAGDETYRTNVLQTALGLSEFINGTTESLKKAQRDINEDVKTVVQTINSLGNQIGSLNDQISKYELDGSRANDLRDARASLIDELSVYVNVESREVEKDEDFARGLYPDPEDRVKSKKYFYVMINGHEFVSGQDVRGLETIARDDAGNPRSRTKTNPMDISGLYDVHFTGGGGLFDVYHPELQGQLKGLIDSRDGNNGVHAASTTVPALVAGPPSTLSFTLNPGMRLDLSPTTPGLLNVTVGGGQTVELRYSSVAINAAGVATFTLDTARTPVPAGFTPVSATVGKTTDYKGIPHYLDKLNELVRTFTRAINEGTDRLGNPIPGVAGHVNGFDALGNNNRNLLFTYKGKSDNTAAITDYKLLTCENFTVNQNLLDNPVLLQAAKESHTPGGTGGGGLSDNRIIHEFLSLKDFKGMFAQGKIQDHIIGTANVLGVSVKQAKNFEKNYTDLTSSIDNQRKSVSGVELNEETTNMIKYQQIFVAAAKLMNIIDGIYDTTINRMGLQ